MIVVLGYRDVGEEAGAGVALGQRHRGRGRLADVAAAAAGHHRPNEAPHPQPCRHQFENFRDVLPDPPQRPAAPRAGGVRTRQFLDLTGQMVGQRRADRLTAGRRFAVRRADRIRRRGGLLFQVLDLEFQLVGRAAQLLRALPEAAPAERGQLVLQRLDHPVPGRDRAGRHVQARRQRRDLRLEGGDVLAGIGAGRGIEHERHHTRSRPPDQGRSGP